MPKEITAHTGRPDVEDESLGITRRPDLMVIAEADMEGPGSFDPRTLVAAIEIVSRSNPDNDWVTKLRDYPLIGIPVYAIFDPRTGTGAALTDIHPTPDGPRYATRKDFVYGEDVTIADWTIPTDGLPRYQSEGGEQE
jgi:Uma2 family endonuclease